MENVLTKPAEKLKAYPIAQLLSLLGFWSLIGSSLTGCWSQQPWCPNQLFVREPVKYYFAIFCQNKDAELGGNLLGNCPTTMRNMKEIQLGN